MLNNYLGRCLANDGIILHSASRCHDVCVCPPHISLGGELVNALYVFRALYSD